MMNRMIVGNLVHRPLRSLISVVAVALEVTLILLIVGLSLGMLQDSRTRTAGIGADVLVLPPESSFIVGLTGAPMPVKIGEVLAKLPHVKSVAPVITTIASAGALEIIAGIELPSYESMSAGFHYLQGGRHDRDSEQQVPHLRDRGTRQGRPQICSAEHSAGPDRRQGQGHDLLSQARRPGERGCGCRRDQERAGH